MRSNKSLKDLYNNQYKEGYVSHHTFDSYEEAKTILDMEDWRGKKVLEIGCGEGNLANMIITAKAKKVDAYDYAEEAIKICKEKYNISGLTFYCADYKTTKDRYDVVVFQGVLEHMDKPFEELDYIVENCLKRDGIILSSSPSFLNPRGYIWMAFLLLLDAPMSLSDIHYFCPFDFEEYCDERGYWLDYVSSDQEWGHGERFLIDYNKRIRNVLKDMNLYKEENVDKFMEWLKKTTGFIHYDDYTGANVVYRIRT